MSADEAMTKTRNISLPVLLQEMRMYQRSSRPFVTMLVYVLILSIVALICVATMASPSMHDPSSMGRDIFAILSMAQLVLVVLSVPALSSNSVVGERERGTFDLLALTKLKSSGIIKQKFGAALMTVVILIIASIPVLSISFMLGGISPWEATQVFAVLFITAAMFGANGLFWSCVVKNSRSSVFVSYLCAILFVLSPVLAHAINQISRQITSSGGYHTPLSTYINPFVAIAAIIDSSGGSMENAPAYTMIFALFCTLLFLYLAVRKFEKLRRS